MSKESPNSAPQSNHNVAGGHSRHRGAWTHLVALLTGSLYNAAFYNLLSSSILQIRSLFSPPQFPISLLTSEYVTCYNSNTLKNGTTRKKINKNLDKFSS